MLTRKADWQITHTHNTLSRKQKASLLHLRYNYKQTGTHKNKICKYKYTPAFIEKFICFSGKYYYLFYVLFTNIYSCKLTYTI